MKKYLLLTAAVLSLAGCHSNGLDRLLGGDHDAELSAYDPCSNIAPVSLTGTDAEIVAAYTFDQKQIMDNSTQFYDARTIPEVQGWYDGSGHYPTAGFSCLGDVAHFRRAVTASVHEGVLNITL